MIDDESLFRTIMLFPKPTNLETINSIRTKYDPLVEVLPPHITLVFPFVISKSDEEIRDIITKIAKKKAPFKVCLKGISKQVDSFGNYLFLNITDGIKDIEDIHNLLYDELSINKPENYAPHVTIGKLSSVELLDKAFNDLRINDEEFTCFIDTIYVEKGNDKTSNIIVKKNLIG